MRKRNRKEKKLKGMEVKFLTKRIKITKKVRFQNMFSPFYGLDRTAAYQVGGRCGCGVYLVVEDQTFWKMVENHLDNYYYFGRIYEREMISKISELKKIGCYKGVRFSQGLPVNGQRTHTNGRTMKRIYGKKKG